MTTPTLPSPPVADRPVTRRRPHRPGELTTGWRLATMAAWGATFLALTGVWAASRQLGLATWWLGPVGSPRPLLVNFLPLYAPLGMVGGALANARRLPWWGLLAAAVTTVIGAVDLGYVWRLGLVELAVAAAMVAFSVASTTGMYRRTSVLH